MWIGGQVTTWNIIAKTLLPSVVRLVLPLLWLSIRSLGEVQSSRRSSADRRGDGTQARLNAVSIAARVSANAAVISSVQERTHTNPSTELERASCCQNGRLVGDVRVMRN